MNLARNACGTCPQQHQWPCSSGIGAITQWCAPQPFANWQPCRELAHSLDRNHRKGALKPTSRWNIGLEPCCSRCSNFAANSATCRRSIEFWLSSDMRMQFCQRQDGLSYTCADVTAATCPPCGTKRSSSTVQQRGKTPRLRSDKNMAASTICSAIRTFALSGAVRRPACAAARS